MPIATKLTSVTKSQRGDMTMQSITSSILFGAYTE